MINLSVRNRLRVVSLCNRSDLSFSGSATHHPDNFAPHFCISGSALSVFLISHSNFAILFIFESHPLPYNFVTSPSRALIRLQSRYNACLYYGTFSRFSNEILGEYSSNTTERREGTRRKLGLVSRRGHESQGASAAAFCR